MDELERPENQRTAIFGIGSFLAFLLFVVATQSPFASGFYGVGTGLILSGCVYAYRITREMPWAYVLAEQRINGGSRSKRGVWLGGIAPGAVLIAAGYWWHPYG